jgi:hypothetical protein
MTTLIQKNLKQIENLVGELRSAITNDDELDIDDQDSQHGLVERIQHGLVERIQHSPFIVAANGHRKLVLRGDTILRLNVGNEHERWFETYKDDCLDIQHILGCNLKPGTDYRIWIVPEKYNVKLEVMEASKLSPTSHLSIGKRLIGGFHTLCADVGEIAGHPLSGYKAGDILPDSVWCLNHRSAGLQSGTVYNPTTDEWVMIYLASGTGKDVQSVFGAKPTVDRNWYDFVFDANKVCGQLLNRTNFISAMDGSPNCTSLGDYPETTGGHTAENGQRIISNIGCEDGTGVLWQWMEDAGDNDSEDWGWKKTDKGSIFTPDNGYDARGLAGGSWADDSAAGVLCWSSDNGSSLSSSHFGARFRFRALHHAE